MATYCERATSRSKTSFDSRSFRWKRSGKARILVGCPRGEWNARAERCRVGTRAYKVLVAAPQSGWCPRGAKKIRKDS